MIGQFVYTGVRKDILMGPVPAHIEQNQGYRCIGSTPSVTREDWLELNRVSNYDFVVEVKGSENKWRPIWTLFWLPSGALAVGKTTHFGEKNVLQRGNHVSHYFILDHELAMANSDHMEKLFSLPFVDFDPNNPADELQRTTFQRMVDYHSLEELGVQDRPIISLRRLMEEYAKLRPKHLRDIVAATMDAAHYKERQMLYAYDSDAANSEAVNFAIMGWVYRLIPKHLRGSVGFAMPFNSMSNSDQTHLAMVPASNVKIGSYYQACSNGIGADCSEIQLGCGYLYAPAEVSQYRDQMGRPQSVIYHGNNSNGAQRQELYRESAPYFTDFLFCQIRALFYDETGDANMKLQHAYNTLYQQGWRNNPQMMERGMLELMSWLCGGGDLFKKLDDNNRRRVLYGWMDLLSKSAKSKLLPQKVCVALQGEILQEIQRMNHELTDGSWFKALRNIIETPAERMATENNQSVDITLADECIHLAAISVAKIWADDFQDAFETLHKWFGDLEYHGNNVEHTILWDYLFVPGNDERRARWEKEGIRCDESDACTRFTDVLLHKLDQKTDIKELLHLVGEYAKLINSLSEELLEQLKARMENAMASWAVAHVKSVEKKDFNDLFYMRQQYLQEQSNKSRICVQMIDLLRRQYETVFSSLNHRADIDTLLHLHEQCKIAARPNLSAADRNMVGYYQREFQRVLNAVRSYVKQKAPDQNLLREAFTVLKLSNGDEESWNVYEEACEKILTARWVNAKWLLDNVDYMYYKEDTRAALVLSMLYSQLNHIPMHQKLKKWVTEKEYEQMMQRVIWLYENRAHMLRRDELYQFIQTENSGLDTGHVFTLLKYGSEHFTAYMDYLIQMKFWNHLMEVIQHQKVYEMEWTDFSNMLLQVRELCKNHLIPINYRNGIRTICNTLWDNYKDKPFAQRLQKAKYVLPVHERKMPQMESVPQAPYDAHFNQPAAPSNPYDQAGHNPNSRRRRR